MRGIAAVLILLPLAAGPSAADDIQSWTDVDLRVLEADRVAWTVGGVARIRDSLGSAYDRRVQTDIDVALNGLLTATVGYILRHDVPAGSRFDWNHRLSAGLTYPILQRGFRLEGTTLYERHVGQPDVADFNRYRQQIDVERPRARVSRGSTSRWRSSATASCAPARGSVSAGASPPVTRSGAPINTSRSGKARAGGRGTPSTRSGAST